MPKPSNSWLFKKRLPYSYYSDQTKALEKPDLIPENPAEKQKSVPSRKMSDSDPFDDLVHWRLFESVL